MPLLATVASGQAQNNDLAGSQPSALEAELKKAQEKAQLAQQNADLATRQRSALEAELRKAQDRAQLAEKSLDLAASQRSALEAELAKAEERVQLAEKSVELGASQRSALEAELEKTREKAQIAQQNADLGASQRNALEVELKKAQEQAQVAQRNADLRERRSSALENELKKAQEKAQLAQQIADLIAAQPHAEETGRSNEEPSEKSADISKNQPESGPAQPTIAGQKARLAIVTRPADRSVESAQATGGSGVASDRARTAAETENKEDKGIGVIEASTPVAVEASANPNNEPVTGDREPVKLAPVNRTQPPVPVTTPSIAASVRSIPPPAIAERSFTAPGEEQSLKQFVLEYIRTVASDDVSTQTRFFEHRVNYYGEGLLSLPNVQTSLERYHREWPIRNWEPRGEPIFPKTLHSTNPKLYEVLQPLTWTVSNGSRHEQGSATLYEMVSSAKDAGVHAVVGLQGRMSRAAPRAAQLV